MVEVTVTGVVAGGDGLARDDDGKVVFVEGAIPGDRVAVEITQTKRDFDRARAVEVIEPSPDRTDPPCPFVAAGCGGCQWQHIALPAQQRLKRDIVVDALRRLAHLPDPPVAAAVPAVAEHAYRTSLRLGVHADGRPAYRRRHSHDLVPVDACLVSHPLLVDLLNSSRFPGAREVVLRVSAATGERVAKPIPPNAGKKPEVPGDVTLGGRIQEDVAGHRWRVSAGSFFQSGPAAAEVLVAALRDAIAGDLPPQGLLVDAYAGIGLLGGALTDERHHLVTIESQSSAVRDAQHNLAGRNARIYQGEVGDWEPKPDERADVVLADPARPGLGKPGVKALTASGAPVIALVSCDPASLARDTTLLAQAGYRLTQVTVLDLFPHTAHVETVSRFAK